MKLNDDDFEVFLERLSYNDFEAYINVFPFKSVHANKLVNSNVILKSTLFILVLNGSGVIDVNFRQYELKAQDIVLLSFGHFFKIKALSEDFTALALYVSKDYVDQMFSADMMYKRVKYGVQMFSNPVINLSKPSVIRLKSRITFIKGLLNDTSHSYQNEMVLNALRIYFLDLSHLLETSNKMVNRKPSNDEIYLKKFLELLVLHYKEQHLVEFYASKINITGHHLTLIIKRLCGETVSEFIFQLIFAEAKIMLKSPKMTIHQIADELHFSDQSAFGKFFKRRSGVSPKEFRNL
ncbi:helix-turn-helix domain-containing protein [Sphingobacterium sp. DK4209]|uniref:Helix-turn-helix domain-containing protein n=1 Tax=Sphingobacterium zhuxiongii TaxID=2662364 RepID=A0A5Q0Q7A1_9SPHI|nr:MULTISPECIES: AraC family transcriptional regulator [unclassified Sphingobacterium]MVZ66995.1 helix-turn-helix domain-containing protein [Sphingobacterium sp. DK4209]QGA25945.1 helix-turn-helix domain-containing protein [Sphingobacterium sp. dk4302]